MSHGKSTPYYALLALALAGTSACAKQTQSQPTTAKRAEATSGQITETETAQATVQAVDAQRRVVTMRDESGQPYQVYVGDKVDLSQIHENDKLRLAYQESIAFALTDKEEKEKADLEGAPEVEESTQRIPEGVQFGRKVSTTVEIVSVTKDGSHATFRVPDGAVRTVYVDDQPSQRKIANMRPGDAVAVTYTEKLAVAVDPAFDD